jgi:succinyldiaminopimelate transaminase
VTRAGFTPPPYPYDRLERLGRLGERHAGGLVDLSVGTPCDPPPPSALAALCGAEGVQGYPAAIGSLEFRTAAARYLARRFGVELGADAVAACVGTKEFVASLPQLLRLRSPERDTVLYPAVSYPTYAMGAALAGCRAVAVPADDKGGLDLRSVSDRDADRALVLWVNSPANPTGALEDLAFAAAFGRAHGVPVVSDECYAEFTWRGRPASILEHGTEGVLALHSLSKRSNLAGLRAGFYAGDPALVGFLKEVRRHAGLMVPGPVQAAAIAALDDDEHVEAQRARYRERLERFRAVLEALGAEAPMPGGAFYLWARVPDGGDQPAWSFAERLAVEAGALVSPGDLYGEPASPHVRVAMVQPLERLELVARRLGLA